MTGLQRYDRIEPSALCSEYFCCLGVTPKAPRAETPAQSPARSQADAAEAKAASLTRD